MNYLLKYISERATLSNQAIKSTLDLLNEDCTLPFIARYRKEATGGLDEVEIGKIIELKEQFETVEKRKNYFDSHGYSGLEVLNKINQEFHLSRLDEDSGRLEILVFKD